MLSDFFSLDFMASFVQVMNIKNLLSLVNLNSTSIFQYYMTVGGVQVIINKKIIFQI